MKVMNSQQWLKKLATFVGVVGAIALISFPVLAQFTRPLRLFQPSAYRRLLQNGEEFVPTSNIAEALAKQSELKTLASALEEAELTKTLQQEGRLTILAPTNQAFEALPPNISRQLFLPENRAKLIAILKYHVIAGEVPLGIIDRGGGQIATVEGSDVQITVNLTNGQVRLNEAEAIDNSIETTNGVIIPVNKVLLPPSIAATLTLRGLNSGTQANPGQTPPAVSINPVSPTVSRQWGFFCDSSTVETKLQKANGQQQVWIRWQSRDFERAGYDPLRRCQEVSSRLETYRKNNQLNFITLGQMNGQNVICTAVQPGSCTNLIYTLQPDEKDPIGALQAFLAWRSQSASARSRLESQDDSVPLIDVRSMLGEEGESTPATAPNNLTPQPQQPGKDGLSEL
jgi:uncharacterized surface protein with fasciclin (FAS1) repeats